MFCQKIFVFLWQKENRLRFPVNYKCFTIYFLIRQPQCNSTHEDLSQQQENLSSCCSVFLVMEGLIWTETFLLNFLQACLAKLRVCPMTELHAGLPNRIWTTPWRSTQVRTQQRHLCPSVYWCHATEARLDPSCHFCFVLHDYLDNTVTSVDMIMSGRIQNIFPPCCVPSSHRHGSSSLWCIAHCNMILSYLLLSWGFCCLP